MNQQQLIPMTTGEYLKQARQTRKLSLAAVSKAIGLDAKLLGEIELEQANHLAPIYWNGYIRTYAGFLDIPEDEILQLLARPDSAEPDVHNIFSAPPQRNLLDKWLRATSYVLASLLIGTLAWQFTHEAVRLSQNGSQLSQSETSSSEASSQNEPAQAQEVRRTVNASIAPMGVLHKGGFDSADTAEQAWAAINGPALAEGEAQLAVTVSADSWIEITDAEGQILEMDLLRGGSEKDYHGKPPFRILLGRAAAVRLSMNGEVVDLSAHTKENVAHFSWPQTLQADNSRQTDQ